MTGMRLLLLNSPLRVRWGSHGKQGAAKRLHWLLEGIAELYQPGKACLDIFVTLLAERCDDCICLLSGWMDSFLQHSERWNT